PTHPSPVFPYTTLFRSAHDDAHHIEGQMPLLAVFLEPLGLGERRGSLFAVHRVQQVPLFLFFEERQLISRVERNVLFINHIQQLDRKSTRLNSSHVSSS